LRQRLEPYLYVLPAVALITIFLLYPMVFTLWQSFTNADGLIAPKFIGLANYARLFGDPNFMHSLRNTLLWTVASVLLPVTLGFIFALNLSRLRGGNLFKIGLYLPATVSAAAGGILFFFIFDPANGALNTLLRGIGLESLTARWLFDTPTNTYAMIAAYTWQATGLNMMLFLVGLQGLPQEPLEAAKLDGCNGWRLVLWIIVPMMMPYIVITSLLAAVNGFKVFDLIWVMTQGGPARSSETLAVTMYREGFILFNQGYSAAIAVVISVIALTFSYLYLRSVLGQESQV
jgi:ABC-type sugar transport system permease subunit